MSSRPLPPIEMVSRSSSVNSSLPISPSVPRGTSLKPDANFKRFVYTYNMLAAQTPMQFYISFVCSIIRRGLPFLPTPRVEPFDGKPTAGQYQFRLSMRVNGIERPLGDPITRSMSADPRKLDFAVL
jgi:hypothetical protein